MAMELPLFLGDGPDASSLFSSLWSSFPDDLQQQPQESVAELKQTLLATTLELEASREELKRKEQSIAKLAELVREVAKERDDARDQLQSLRLLAAQAQAAAAAAAAASTQAPAPPLVTSSVTDSDCSLVSSPVDPFFDPVTSADRRCTKLSPATSPASAVVATKQQCQPGGGGGVGSAADAVLDMLASKRPLPHKGRLLAAVMEAGPLLQNLLVAGQLPRWRNPPTVRAPDTLALGAARAAGYVAAAAPVAAGADAVTLASTTVACMKRPMASTTMSMLPLTPMLPATSCSSPGFIAKRQRLQH